MPKLSKKEWIAIAVAVIFVGYTLFGGDIVRLFQKNAINDNSLAAANTNTGFSNKGVIIKDILIGQGPEVKKGQLVSVNYILSLSDNTIIQNSKDSGQPFQFVLGASDFIKGWELGFEGMRVGGIRTISIPPELAYGPNQVGPIPPNSTLIFTIELVSAEDVTSQKVQ